MRARLILPLFALALAVGTLVITELDRPVAAQAAPIDVGLGAFVFEPADLWATPGTIVFNLINVDSRRHNMVIDVAGVPVESETLSAGTSGVFEVTIAQPGEYEFYCSVGNHREQGMVGKLVVQQQPTPGRQAGGAAATDGERGEGTITLALLWVHVPFAIAWIGVALVDAFLAVAPGLSPAQRGSLIRLTLPFVYVAIPVIVLTGIWQTVYNPVTRPMWSLEILEELKRTTYGWALFYKHAFVVATLVATLAIKLVLVRRLTESTGAVAMSGTGAIAGPPPHSSDRTLQAAAWINVLCCLAILICVVLMVWQLH